MFSCSLTNHGYCFLYEFFRAFALHLRHQLPILVLAVTDSTSVADENVKTMISDGNAVADVLKAHFMTTPHFQHQRK